MYARREKMNFKTLAVAALATMLGTSVFAGEEITGAGATFPYLAAASSRSLLRQ